MSIWVAKKSTDTSDHLFFGERLKLESVSDHTVNMKFNVFLFNVCKRFLKFLRILTFFILISTFFYMYEK